jgi:hypothetical protein
MPAANLFLTTDLKSLPPGWSSAATGFSCGVVSTGNGCQLTLTYAPQTLARGTLTLNYDFDDAGGAAMTGSTNIAYAATTDDNVVGLATPSGQIVAVVGAGSQAVSVAFTTDDGRPATALQLTGGTAALPQGWTGPVGTFTCSGLNGGPGCELPLSYAPTAADSGTLTLNFAYINDAGVSKTGSLNVAYRATTDDVVVATPSPGTLAVLTGTSTAVNIDFATDDGNPASALSVTSGLAPLPAGWTAASNSFGCASVSSGTACRLALTYAPSVPATGTLTLGFSYSNDAGFMKSATLALAYAASAP